jgi:hypothetical protein
MYALFRNASLGALLSTQAPALLISLVVAELFFKWKSFALECLGFLALWFVTCAAFAKISTKCPSRMCQTGFQYTPVASIATCVHPALSSHSASANNPCVVVGKRRTSCRPSCS